MIIGIDAGCLGIQDKRLKVGVYHMAKSLFETLAKLDTENIYLLYSFYPIKENLLKSFGKNVKNIVVKPVRGWTKIWLPLRLLRDKPDVFVGLNQSLPLKLPLQTYKSIVVIHDLLFEEHPASYSGSFRKLHSESKSSAHRADTIIAVSKATKNDIEKFYKISKEKITVIYEGIRNFPMTKDQRPKINYFLFVGALKPQKNIPVLLKAFSKIKNQEPGIMNLNLLIVGGDKWKDEDINKTYATLPGVVKSRVQFLGNVSEERLASLYKHALVFVSPSLSEGFGLTFLESLSFGVPVIGPNTGAVPEVVGDAGMLIDPTQEKDLVQAMEKMLDSKARLVFQKKARAQLSKFSWEKFVKNFLIVIESAS